MAAASDEQAIVAKASDVEPTDQGLEAERPITMAGFSRLGGAVRLLFVGLDSHSESLSGTAVSGQEPPLILQGTSVSGQPILSCADYDRTPFAPGRASSEQDMKYAFRWRSDVSDSKKASAEEAIRELQESGDSPISFCHDGPAVVVLALSETSPTRFSGTMECSCGRTRGIIRGKCNGSSVTFEPVAS